MTPSENIVASCPYCGTACFAGYGKRHCGCGRNSSIATRSAFSRGVTKGHPQKFIWGHGVAKRRPNLDDAIPFKIDGVYCRLIPLTRGQYAIVDDADYASLIKRSWAASFSSLGGCYYAISREPRRDGVRGITILMHREILKLSRRDVGDHINGITLDNRRKNLRHVTISQSCMNRDRRIDNASGMAGVRCVEPGKRWRVSITFGGKRKNVGTFYSFESACRSREEAEKKYHGKFARAR
jgi:hypothetical protein